MARGLGTAMKFDAKNPRAVAWARTRAAKLVTGITDDTRLVIRSVVSKGLEQGMSPNRMARLIRASVGLTERDADAVMNYQSQLVAKGTNLDVALRRAVSYADKLVRHRASTIARTETMRASNEGQRELWQQAVDQGLLTGNERKVWIASDPCPICEALDGQIVDMDESFDVGVAGPPAHPNCRCTIGMVL